MRVIAYYTNARYHSEAKLLERSLVKVGINDYSVVSFSQEEEWNRATAAKAEFIREMRVGFSGGLLYVDVDAFFHSDPSEFFDALSQSKYDFAAHWFQGPSGGYDRSRNDNHFLSGTMWFGDTIAARQLIDAWCGRNKEKQCAGDWKGGGQANLRDILDEGLPLKIYPLPGRFCYVFDKAWAYPSDEPCVIEHLIASRENRDESKGKTNRLRQARIKALEKLLS